MVKIPFLNINIGFGKSEPKADPTATDDTKKATEPAPAPAPTPAPQPKDNKVTYTYVRGDYFSKVLVKLGLSEGKLWGNNGTVKYYTKQLIEQNVLDKRGNVKIGVPFTLIKR